MKLSLFLLALIPAVNAGPPAWSGGSDSDSGGPADSCSTQKGCLTFTTELIPDDDLCGDACYYKICMTLDTSADGCAKDGTMSHYCDYDDGSADTCQAPGNNLSNGSDIEGTNHIQCLNIKKGQEAHFLLKDGGECADTDTWDEGTGTVAMCAPSGQDPDGETIDFESCSGNAAGMECIWVVTAPLTCPTSTGGASGDPHIKRWGRKSFEFHGECDLVLAHSDHVNGDKVLDVHIRTVIREWWSQIESAAMRVGDVIFEIDSDKFFVNGKQYSDADLPIETAEFTITEPYEGAAITKAIHGEEENVLKTYAVELTDKSVVTFKVLGDLMNVAINGHEFDFGESTGLMGDFYFGKPYNRLGERMYDLEEFAFEWQVDPSVDPILFVESKGPQLPTEKCRMPDVAKTERKLRNQSDRKLNEQANRACSGKDEYDACMSDIMATGNVNVALVH